MSSEEILINVTPRETRVAIVESGVLQELFIERASKRGLVGNIYKGRVSRVLPGMQAAFVDIGLDRAAFLHASDIQLPLGDEPDGERRQEEGISALCCEGQEILVQVVKDPLGTKGARLTTHLSLPSRYLVFIPGMDYVGISQRIESEAERTRLREIVHTVGRGEGGVIVRTAAEGVSDKALSDDLEFLHRLWASIRETAHSAPVKTILYEDLPLMMRCLRDLGGGVVEKVRIDSRETYLRVCSFAEQLIPEIVGHIEHYTGKYPLFDLYGVEDEIQKALERKVQLKSGGHLVIDQTEAMTTIDVNTGAFVGHRNLEETIFKTNLEAAVTIARQLRLRNLGGIIIIDFIDMLEEEHKRQVLRALEKALERDHAKSHVGDVSALGLVEMTRKRTRESLAHILCEPCPVCHGRGFIKAVETVAYEIFREIIREARQFDPEQFLVLASQEVVDLLLDDESSSLAELAAFIGKPIKLQVESFHTQEQFDVVLM
ncbi:RNase G [Gammaproteobacteria bacterium]